MPSKKAKSRTRAEMFCHVCGNPVGNRGRSEFCSTTCTLLGNIECDPQTGCWIWLLPQSCNQPRLFTSEFGQKKKLSVRREMYKLAFPVDEDFEDFPVTSTCKTPMCVNPLHLRLGSVRARNVQDTRLKLDPELVAEIRSLQGVMLRHVVALKYNVCENTITKIWNHTHWKEKQNEA